MSEFLGSKSTLVLSVGQVFELNALKVNNLGFR